MKDTLRRLLTCSLQRGRRQPPATGRCQARIRSGYGGVVRRPAFDDRSPAPGTTPTYLDTTGPAAATGTVRVRYVNAITVIGCSGRTTQRS